MEEQSAPGSEETAKPQAGPITSTGRRLSNIWRRGPAQDSPAATTSIAPPFETQSRPHQPPPVTSQQGARVTNQQRAPVEPSPSVEPPQVSAYKFNTSPSPAFFLIALSAIPIGNYGEQQEESAFQPLTGGAQPDGASLPPPQPLRVDSISLEDIPEAGTIAAQQSVAPNNTSVSKTTATAQPRPDSLQTLAEPFRPGSPRNGSSATPATSSPSSFRAIPRKPRMNPDAYKLTPTTGPRPPEEVVNHAELIRHGGQFVPNVIDPTTEAGYQLAIAPPVTTREAPPHIVLDPATLQASAGPPDLPSNKHGGENGTWASTPGTMSGLVPPVSKLPMSSPNVGQRVTEPTEGFLTKSASGELNAEPRVVPVPGPADTGPYDVNKPTCSLNLVCYRSGAKGCDLQQIQCILPSKFPTDESFRNTVNTNKHLVYTDQQFFREMRRLFRAEMNGLLRRYFSLKSHKAFRILMYTPTTRPTVVPFDDFVLQEMMFAYCNPDKISSSDDWVQWVFRLRRKDKRHAVEFVEGWNSSRIAIAGTIPWLSSCIVGIAWTAAGGEVQSAFTVASFILTSSSNKSYPADYSSTLPDL